MKSVAVIIKNEICCGCGTCEAICPAKAISVRISMTGNLEPEINEKCIDCGKCLEYCPQASFNYADEQIIQFGEKAVKPLVGTYKELFNARAKDEDVLRNSTSGAAVITIIKNLLQDSIYDSAFLVDTYNYSNVVKTVRYTKGMDFSNVPKSRYIQVSHVADIKYMLENSDEKIIFVGTACFMHAVLRVIKQNNLNRENYLLIGLFCDKTMSYHVWNYFNSIFAEENLEGLIFRDKNPSGWPGNVKMLSKDGKVTDISKKERMAVKEYFMPESCMYCMDKLNRFSDFSVGDNYTATACYEGGSNTVFVRTERASKVWKAYESHFMITNVNETDVIKSQKLEQRYSNLRYAQLAKKDVQGFECVLENDASEWEKKYETVRNKIECGKKGDYKAIYTQVFKNRKKREFIYLFKQSPKKIVYFLAKKTGMLSVYKKIKDRGL